MIEPKSIDLPSPSRLRIVWKDGLTSDLDARALRLGCPCAQCVEEWSGRKILHDASVPLDIQLLGAELVGRYGLALRWSDQHATGIFTWDRLRAFGVSPA